MLTDQDSVHPNLSRLVTRHRQTAYLRPVSDAQRSSFAVVDQRVREHGGPVVLDAGCGTGASTKRLALRHRDSLVVGIDKSAVRLRDARGEPDLPNAITVRGELIDVWRLALAAGWPVAEHYLLYPNPWPKAKQLQRRWHAHAVFPSLLKLGLRLELRSNWRIYVAEFAQALRLHGYAPDAIEEFVANDALTPFEAKYAASGHTLYRLVCKLGAPATSGRAE